MRRQKRALLKELMADKFNEEELKSLVFDLDIKWGELSGDTLSNKAESLIAYVENRSRLQELIAELKKRRPNIAWPSVEEKKLPFDKELIGQYPLPIIGVLILLLTSLVILSLPTPRNALIAIIAPSPTPTITSTPSVTPALTPSATATPTLTPTRAVTVYLVNTDSGPTLSLEPFGIGLFELIYDETYEMGVPVQVQLNIRPEGIEVNASQVFVSLNIETDLETGSQKLVKEELESTPSPDLIDEVPLYPVMLADLSSLSDVSITPSEPEQKIILAGQITTWRWQVKPLVEHIHMLELTISIPVNLSENDDTEAIIYPLKNITFPIVPAPMVTPSEAAEGDSSYTFLVLVLSTLFFLVGLLVMVIRKQQLEKRGIMPPPRD
ncbi:MAG: hypothetical protein IPM39_27505 [Chloroflexi bacterium]|nr:hypothetical protein [Chloroflexota bacterium]